MHSWWKILKTAIPCFKWIPFFTPFALMTYFTGSLSSCCSTVDSSLDSSISPSRGRDLHQDSQHFVWNKDHQRIMVDPMIMIVYCLLWPQLMSQQWQSFCEFRQFSVHSGTYIFVCLCIRLDKYSQMGGWWLVQYGKCCVYAKRMFSQNFRIYEKKLAWRRSCLVYEGKSWNLQWAKPKKNLNWIFGPKFY